MKNTKIIHKCPYCEDKNTAIQKPQQMSDKHGWYSEHMCKKCGNVYMLISEFYTKKLPKGLNNEKLFRL